MRNQGLNNRTRTLPRTGVTVFLLMLLGLFLFGFTFGGQARLYAQANTDAASSSNSSNVVSDWLVSVDWLKQNLSKVVIIDARSSSDYWWGHIKGARNATWQDWSNMSVPQGKPGWSVLLPFTQLAAKFAALGIDTSRTLVVYADPLKGWGEDARALWSLRTLGFSKSYLLDGGWSAWNAANGEREGGGPPAPLTVSAAELAKRPAPQPDPTLVADTNYIMRQLGLVQLLDLREPAEFAGNKTYGEPKSGRMPGAINVYFKDLYRPDGRFKSPSELRALFERAGLRRDAPVITYCTGGIRSSVGVIALKLAGYSDVRNYDASFSEWTGTGQRVER